MTSYATAASSQTRIHVFVLHGKCMLVSPRSPCAQSACTGNSTGVCRWHTCCYFIHGYACIHIHRYVYVQLNMCQTLMGEGRGYSFSMRILKLSQRERRQIKNYFCSCFINPWKLASGFSVIENVLVFNGSPWRASNYMLENPRGLRVLSQPLRYRWKVRASALVMRSCPFLQNP